VHANKNTAFVFSPLDATLGEVRYLNTANIRLRTLLRPDPTAEIETITLVTNR